MSRFFPASAPAFGISDVPVIDLCCSCGACAGACPSGAVTMQPDGSFPHPAVDAGKCSDCGLCRDVCPGLAVDFETLKTEFLGESKSDPLIGPHREVFVGAVSDEMARYKRTSGGLAKGIAIWGMENGLWQGALVTASGGGFPAPKTFLATTPEQVNSASGSLYCPVPACQSWAQLKDFQGKVCFVGLPCHVAALRKAQMRLPWLKEKVAFVIGLFCSGSPGFDATEAFLKFHGIARSDVTSFLYRGDGWPGDIVVELPRGQVRKFPRGKAASRMDRLKFAACFQRRGAFVLRRCLLCPDHTAELADVSLGDPWHAKYRTDKLGLNVAVVRSSRAAEVFTGMDRDESITFERVGRDFLVESQRACLASKKRLGPVVKLFDRLELAVPGYTGQADLPTKPADSLIARFEWFQVRLARSRKFWPLLPWMSTIMAILRKLGSKGVS